MLRRSIRIVRGEYVQMVVEVPGGFISPRRAFQDAGSGQSLQKMQRMPPRRPPSSKSLLKSAGCGPLVQSVSLTAAFSQYRGRPRPRRRYLHHLDAPEIEGVLVERLSPPTDP